MAKSDFLNRVAQMPANKWTESLFTLLDIEENSEMSFSDFLLVLSTYCMFDADAVVKRKRLWYNCAAEPQVSRVPWPCLIAVVLFSFDRDKNGKIDMEELMELLVALHGKHMEENVKLAVETIDKGGFDITYKELRKINKVLWPMQRCRLVLRMIEINSSASYNGSAGLSGAALPRVPDAGQHEALRDGHEVVGEQDADGGRLPERAR
jgi:hypothetical protein